MLENLQPTERRGVNQVAVNELLHMKISFPSAKKGIPPADFSPGRTPIAGKNGPP